MVVASDWFGPVVFFVMVWSMVCVVVGALWGFRRGLSYYDAPLEVEEIRSNYLYWSRLTSEWVVDESAWKDGDEFWGKW